MLLVLFLFLIFICWGSFLNVVAYRITYDKPFLTKRSYCPHCESFIAWYDNIPILSWLLLGGKCRSCKKSISYLYPLIEIASGLIFTALFYELFPDFFSSAFIAHYITYFIFFSALIISTRTDLQEMVIPQIFSIWLIPVGVIAAFLGFSFVSPLGAIIGAALGYGILWVIAKLFFYFAKREGMGEGDMELLGMIGSFLGPVGVWFTLLAGSIAGFLIGGVYMLISGKGRYAKIPFGPFLALGATLYFFGKITGLIDFP